jgi:AcrR family transcriptional regulator
MRGRTAPAREALNGASAELSARNRLIEAASRLFCRYGINAIGVDAVVSEAGTAKATLYKNFGSKEGLVEAVLVHEGAAWREWFLGALLEGEASPAEKLNRVFPLLRHWFSGAQFFGCPFLNAVGEHDKNDSRLRDLTMAHKMAVLGPLGDLANAAGAEAPEALAHQLGLLMDGAIIAAMVTRDPGAADVGASMARMLLAGALRPAATQGA